MTFKRFSLALIFGTFIGAAAASGIPTVDGVALGQRIMSLIEQLEQKAKMVEQYTLQLKQYETQLTNLAKLNSPYLKSVSSLMDSFNRVNNSIGNVQNYANQMKGYKDYFVTPCFQEGASCSAEEMTRILQKRLDAMQVEKESYDSMIAVIDEESQKLEDNIVELNMLKRDAAAATGELQALDAANQLAVNQAQQLHQLRTMLVSQHQAQVAKWKYEENEKARMAAADAKTINLNHKVEKSVRTGY